MNSPMDSVDFRIVYRTVHKRDCLERALVLKAVGIEHEMRNSFGGYELVVADSKEADAREQLGLYDAENTSAIQRVAQLELKGDGVSGAAGYCLILLLFFYFQNSSVFGVDWLEVGRMDVKRVQNGEWWRTFTALMLHLDAGHLISNLFFGMYFGIFTSQTLGSGTAWASILVAGAGGNALNLFFHGADHRAIGASTGVFAALGMLSAFGCIHGWVAIGSWPRRWGPVIGGVILLAFLGTGGRQTDVTAHLTGFVVGLAFGFFFGKQHKLQGLQLPTQLAIGITTLAWILLVWRIAILKTGI